MDELKKCPFCGADAFLWEWNGGTAIQCEKFNGDSHLVQIRGKNRAEVIELWNRRAEDE